MHDRWKTPEPDFLLAHYKRGVTLAAGFKDGAVEAVSHLDPVGELAGRCRDECAGGAGDQGRPAGCAGDDSRAGEAGRFLRKSMPERWTRSSVSQSADGLMEHGAEDWEVIRRWHLCSRIRCARASRFGSRASRGALVTSAGGAEAGDQRDRSGSAPLGPMAHEVNQYLAMARYAGAGNDMADGRAGGECRIPAAHWASFPAPNTARRNAWPVENFAEVAEKICGQRASTKWADLRRVRRHMPAAEVIAGKLNAELRKPGRQNHAGGVDRAPPRVPVGFNQ